MGKIGTFQEALRDAIIAEDVALPEFVDGSVVIASGRGQDAQSLENELATSISKSSGLSLLLFGREGTTPDVDSDLRMKFSMKIELYVHPYKRDLTLNPSLRGADELVEALMVFLHDRSLGDVSGHPYDEIHVTGFSELSDPDFIVFQINIQRMIDFN